MSSPPKPPKWRYSDAKDTLRKDIIEGKCTGKTAAQVYAMHPEEYGPYKFDNFSTNFYNLRAHIQQYQGYAEEDAKLFEVDKKHHVRPPITARGYPQWDESEAEAQLKRDIDAGEHKKQKPQQLRLTNEEYKKYPKKVFRDHIYQEVRNRTAKTYWKPVMEAKAKKKKVTQPDNVDFDAVLGKR